MDREDRSAPPPYGRFPMGPAAGDRLPPLPYEVLEDAPGERLVFRTAPSRRRAAGVLHAAGATVPVLAALFALPLLPPAWDPGRLLVAGLAAAAVLALAGFLAGRRGSVTVSADRGADTIERVRVPALGPARVWRGRLSHVRRIELRALLRTLGADLELVARTEAAEVPLGEGDPHTGQIRALAEKLAAVAGVALERGEPR